ncbi:GNAT family N-acetyltransferase [Erwinia sp. S43]|uniref:GNAT family N-acetyltransferase n=1 Tax=Erwinia sp. S43 TaxID=2769339 RepID=UPI00210694A1|nr:GNAT family N-acetyltransferase [Erwinia sp. S43]
MIKLRIYREGDEAALLKVFLSSIRDIASRDYTPDQIAAWAPEDMDPQRWASHIKQLQPFVVELEGEIAGYADVQPNGYIDHFFVAGNCPKQGVGTLLMKAIHDEARRLGLSELTSNVSKTAEGFFLRQGFHVVERGFPVRRGVTLQNALMRKELRTADRTDIAQS